MNKEEARKIVDTIKQEEFPYALAIAKSYEKLEQENKELKEKLDISEANYDIIYDYFSQVNKLLGTELCEEAIDEIIKLKRNNNILTEFEKWFEKQMNFYKINNQGYSYKFCKRIFNKLQELKEGKK